MMCITMHYFGKSIGKYTGNRTTCTAKEIVLIHLRVSKLYVRLSVCRRVKHKYI